YRQVIEPLLRASRPFVEFLGEVGGRDKDEFLGNAHALLFPIDWPEPFGLVMIEALACGTPVVGFRRGSVPEVLADGRTGFVVDDVDGAVRAVGPVAGLSRHGCRREFEERFDAARMARDYLEVYRGLTHDGAGRAGAREAAAPPAGRPGGETPGLRRAPLLGALPAGAGCG